MTKRADEMTTKDWDDFRKATNTGKQNFSLGVEYVALINAMANAEDRPMARIMRKALENYAVTHHPGLAAKHLYQERSY